MLGIDVPNNTIAAILSRMNYTLEIDGDNITATPPAYREDIEGSAADLAEDVIKKTACPEDCRLRDIVQNADGKAQK